MYYFNLTFLSFREWRITHSMSHHLYPNSLHDLEVTMFEPFLCWVTNSETKNLFQRYASWLYAPIIYTLLYAEEFLKRIVLTVYRQTNLIYKEDFIPFLLPVIMFLLGGNVTIGTVLKIWILMLFVSSFIFGIVGLNAGHHNHHVAQDGDILRYIGIIKISKKY